MTHSALSHHLLMTHPFHCNLHNNRWAQGAMRGYCTMSATRRRLIPLTWCWLTRVSAGWTLDLTWPLACLLASLPLSNPLPPQTPKPSPPTQSPTPHPRANPPNPPPSHPRCRVPQLHGGHHPHLPSFRQLLPLCQGRVQPDALHAADRAGRHPPRGRLEGGGGGAGAAADAGGAAGDGAGAGGRGGGSWFGLGLSLLRVWLLGVGFGLVWFGWVVWFGLVGLGWVELPTCLSLIPFR